MRVWESLSFFSEASSACFERGELAAQRRDLLVEDLDLGQRPGAHAFLAVERAGERGDPALRLGE